MHSLHPWNLTRFSYLILIASVFTVISTQAEGAPPATQPKGPPSATQAASSLSASKSGSKLLWDSWYTVTIGKPGSKGSQYAYYNDHVETQPAGKLFFQNRMWKREEGYVNEEALGALALDDPNLTPLFFNFQRQYRLSEMRIDGSAKDQELTVRVREGSRDLPVIRRSTLSKAIWSVFFPVWLQRHYSEMKPGVRLSFMTILEDNLEQQFAGVSGNLLMEKPDDFANKSNTRKLSVHYRDLKSTWYIEPNGMPVRIEMPEQNTLIEKASSKEAAEKFFKSGG